MFKTLELKQKLIDTCNQSELPFEAIYFVVKDLWRDTEETLHNIESKELEDEQKEEEEESC